LVSNRAAARSSTKQLVDLQALRIELHDGARVQPDVARHELRQQLELLLI
jgi:hypothetical protein